MLRSWNTTAVDQHFLHYYNIKNAFIILCDIDRMHLPNLKTTTTNASLTTAVIFIYMCHASVGFIAYPTLDLEITHTASGALAMSFLFSQHKMQHRL